MTGIAPGAYVRVTRGMYAGTTGRVVSVHERPMPVGHSWAYATVDVGEAQPITVYLSALELVGATSTVEQECDAAIAERDRLREIVTEANVALDVVTAERDRLRAEVTDLLPEADAKQHFATRALRAEERLDRLRREVETLRDSLRTNRAWAGSEDADALWHELDAILRGES